MTEILSPAPDTDLIGNLLTSFESRIQKIEDVFSASESVNESSQSLISDLRLSLDTYREERLQANAALRENLARAGSLRRNDYDILMSDVYFLLDKKEKEAKDQFLLYVDDQKEMVRFLRQAIIDLKNPATDSAPVRLTEFKNVLQSVLDEQHQRKETTIAKFLEFQQIHQNIIALLQSYLDQDARILRTEFKNVKKQLLEVLN